MREKIISFFLKRHLLTNMLFVAVFLGGIFAWQQIPKEELPDITFDTVRITVNYPGASTEEVEYYVTKPIEEVVRNIDGVYRVLSSTSVGNCRVTAEIENDYPNKDEVITEIRNEVLDVDLPQDIIDDPHIRVFKTSRKAIIDIGLYDKEKTILDVQTRKKLQTYAYALENKLLAMPHVHSVNRTAYLNDEIHIKVYPQKLIEYNIPFNTVMREIQNSNVRQPAGSIENVREPKVTLWGELTTIEELKNLSVQGGFEGQVVRLSDVADVVEGFEKTKTVNKINGHEGLFLKVVKSSRYGILDAVDAVSEMVDKYKDSLEGSSIEVILLDDESVDVRNRIGLISINGAIGFVLVIVALFLFLDFRSGIWVAMGIPFTFCVTLIIALWMGYTINNITLAAVIIVMGMVVDDAIVVAENINRSRSKSLSPHEASMQGTAFVLLPITASIVTTCIAFVPLFFFSGRFGVMVRFIPPIVFMMLGASLLEAICVLPGHMMLPFSYRIRCAITLGLWPAIERFLMRRQAEGGVSRRNWFHYWEDRYEEFIKKALPFKWFIFLGFIFLLIFSGFIAQHKMKFVMFPDEETKEIRMTAEAAPGTKRYETAALSQKLENMLREYIGKEVVGFRNDIGRSRRGSAALENRLRMRIEVVPREKRKKSGDQLVKEWESRTADYEGLKKIQFRKARHGSSSGSPIEINVRENNNKLRKQISDELAQKMREYSDLVSIEIDRPAYNPEYYLKLNRDKIRRLAINPSDIAKTLRASLEGTILYDFSGDDEPVYVRLTTIEEAKDDIDKIFEIPVENQGQYLVPLNDLVDIEEKLSADSIEREDLKRSTLIYADLKPGTKKTPLEIAEHFENNIFEEFQAQYPSAIIEFAGEVKDSRESSRDFQVAIIMVIGLIYIILALLFNSLATPFLIMLAIPFGVVGIIFAFWLHGIALYGFFAVIGALGLAGVVINDAIIMVVKLETEYSCNTPVDEMYREIARIAKTRLRAVILTTLTTIVAIIPTAYGWAGYDSMLAQMMLALGWGLLFGTVITLVLIPCVYSVFKKAKCTLS